MNMQTNLRSQAPPRLTNGSLRRGLAIQGNVIGALIMRELHTRYGRENVGYLWIILEPLTLAGMVAILHSGERTHFGSDFRGVPFAILGYCVFIMFRGIVLRSEGALEANLPLLYHKSVTIFDILFSRAVLEAAGTFVTFLILISLAWVMGLGDLPARPLELMFAIFYMLWFSFGISMIITAGTYENTLASRFVHPITYIMMPISGAFYQLKWLPEPFRSIMTWFPLTQVFEFARYGQFESADMSYVKIPYLTGCCMVGTLVGLLAIKIIRPHIRMR